jgi:UDP-N-acetylglucosamine 2-epimerase (non-hydrolysing)
MIAIILGTRPEIIKMSPIIRECQDRDIPFFILHTGQHYSYEMDKAFFKDLKLPQPKYNLDVGSGSHAIQTAGIMTGTEKILLQERPDIALVQGDTNTVLGGALAASKLHIKLGHVEAGLRSFDRQMPEEINRIVSDHISDLLFAPTDISRVNLRNEGISEEKIFLTGNTIVDAVHQNQIIAESSKNILKSLNLIDKEYFLITLHRAENVDEESRINEIFKSLSLIHDFYSMPIIFPIHPRTRKMVEQFNINTDGVILINPIGFLEFLQLESHAKVVLTDSGGVQEETCILGVPCVTIRENTERPETIEVGSNILAGISSDNIFKCVKKMGSINKNWSNPFGDGYSGRRIIEILKKVQG